MSIKYKFPNKIENNYQSFSSLINLYQALMKLFMEDVYIDFSNTNYLEANLSALIGAIFDDTDDFVNINFKNFQPRVQTILQKNDFLSNYGYTKIEDRYDTTIKYKKFKSNDTQPFYQYINDELLTKHDFPKMSESFRKDFAKSLLEIFVNADIHAHCDFVYTCGQYFPNKKDLYFTIVNTGTTIKQNVCKFFERDDISGMKAINWAVQKNTTTKQGISGGLGFATVRSFIRQNKGALQVISDDGYWSENVYGRINMKEFSKSFVGTVVNLKIKMDDTQDYKTIEEQFDEIFF